MDDETIGFLRTLCAKVKEVANLCDAYLERQARKNKSTISSHLQPEGPGTVGNRFIPVSKWPEYHCWPTANGLRHLIFTSYSSGADYFVRRAGRRVLICEKSFFEWANMSEEQRIKVSPDAARWKEKYGKIK